MRIPTPIQALSAAAALALLAGCSSGSAIAPKMSTPQGHVSNMMGHVPAAVSAIGASRINVHPSHSKSFFACPATGLITYMSDFNTSTINIYAGTFAGQAPCGQITGLANPQGLFVKKHDLYVANTGGTNILAFHRGSTSPFNTYTDGLANYTVDVTISKDNILIATNIFNSVSGPGSISTWKIGANGGTFLHNYPNPSNNNDYFLTVQEKTTDIVYYDDSSAQVYKVACPAGTCGAPSPTGVALSFPGGIRSGDETAEKEDLIVDDQTAATLTTFETFPTGTSCSTGASDGVSFDISKSNKLVFLADAGSDTGRELKYPSCALVGTVPGNSSGLPISMGTDPAGSIR